MANLRPEPESLEEKYLTWESRLRRWKLGWAAPLVKHPWAIRMTTAWIAVVVMAAAVSWWLLVPAADWLAPRIDERDIPRCRREVPDQLVPADLRKRTKLFQLILGEHLL